MNVYSWGGSSVVVCLCSTWLAGTAWLVPENPRQFFFYIFHSSAAVAGMVGQWLGFFLSFSRWFHIIQISSFLNMVSRFQDSKTERCKGFLRPRSKSHVTLLLLHSTGQSKSPGHPDSRGRERNSFSCWQEQCVHIGERNGWWLSLQIISHRSQLHIGIIYTINTRSILTYFSISRIAERVCKGGEKWNTSLYLSVKCVPW